MAQVDSTYASPKSFQVVYERRLKSGEVTQHTLDVVAYKPEIAEMVFHWRVEVPHDVDSQVILTVSPTTHH